MSEGSAEGWVWARTVERERGRCFRESRIDIRLFALSGTEFNELQDETDLPLRLHLASHDHTSQRKQQEELRETLWQWRKGTERAQRRPLSSHLSTRHFVGSQTHI
ncbi:hypothetical protein ILYODFUR_026019 [Ilyodon furcidens]|uniref:Uncharacterized protein n=1 Tax=Ilyodon furcidens TaxID=33524 RepID=A0ABV0UV78_9TELE